MIIWEDPALLAVDKPAGLSTLVDGFNPGQPFLLQLLKATYDPLWVIHRLDKETSGVILFARSSEAHRSLNDQFAGRTASKTYHALVSGCPPWKEKKVDMPLRANGDRRHRTVIDHQRGKPSATLLTVLESFENHALLQAVPLTGRTHQIRAHLAAVGYPLLADALYSRASVTSSDKPLIDRAGLHAYALQVTHPVTGAPLTFTAPYPQDLETALHHLRNC